MFVQTTQNPFEKHSNSASNSRESWKNDAFLNLSLPNAQGELRKIGSIGLKLRNHREAGIIQAFERNPEAAAKWLIENLVVQYNNATADEKDVFAIPV